MKPSQEQALVELKRQLEEVCVLDRIDCQTIRELQNRLQELESEDPHEAPESGDPADWFPD